jgi:hypothetical protein
MLLPGDVPFSLIFYSASFWASWTQLTNTLLATFRRCDAFMPANPSNFYNFLLMSLWASPMKMTFFFFLKFFSFIYSHVHTLFELFFPPHLLSLLLILPHFQAEPVLPLFLFVEEKT